MSAALAEGAQREYDFKVVHRNLKPSQYHLESKASTDKNNVRFDVERPNKDWRGLHHDTGAFFLYQILIVSVLYNMPETFSGWSDEQKEDWGLDRYKNNVRKVAWDEDEWYVNYLLHPYWGSAYYIRARQRGFGHIGGFAYSALLSTLFEYGFESIFETPSIQDLIVTPISGSIIGKWVWQRRQRIAAINARPVQPGVLDHTKMAAELSTADRWFLWLSDPLGTMNSVMGRAIGFSSGLAPFYHVSSHENLTIVPFVRLSSRFVSQMERKPMSGKLVVGFQFYLPL